MRPSGFALVTPQPAVDEVCNVDVTLSESLTHDRWGVVTRSTHFGGAGFHCSLAPQGLHTHHAPIFPLAMDPDGDRLIDELRLCGIDTNQIIRIPGTMPHNLVIQFRDGERRIIRSPASITPDFSRHATAVIPASRYVLLAGSLPLRLAVAVVNAVNRCGLPWAWNPAVSHFGLLRRGLAQTATVVQLNVEEATLLVHAGRETTPTALLPLVSELTGAQHVVITAGRAGAVARNGTQAAVPAPSLAGPLIGKGDRHFVLYSWAVSMGADAAESLRFAANNL